MVSGLLPVAILAGAAAAACPLAVNIASATDHVTEVTVTNTGSETLTVFKGNTVFSEHATKDLVVADAGKFLSSLRIGFVLGETTNNMNRRKGPSIRRNLCQLQENWSHIRNVPDNCTRREDHNFRQCCKDIQP
jgi:hypothetical protein